jgi:large subunit ribosomal protein L32
MPEPKKRKSHSASRLKHAKTQHVLPQLVSCSHCKAKIKAGRICPICGYYKGKKVLKMESAVKTKIKEDAK